MDRVISEAREPYEKKCRFMARGFGLDDIAKKAAEIIGIDPDLIWLKGIGQKA